MLIFRPENEINFEKKYRYAYAVPLISSKPFQTGFSRRISINNDQMKRGYLNRYQSDPIENEKVYLFKSLLNEYFLNFKVRETPSEQCDPKIISKNLQKVKSSIFSYIIPEIKSYGKSLIFLIPDLSKELLGIDEFEIDNLLINCFQETDYLCIVMI